jgi:hypothetical protein
VRTTYSVVTTRLSTALVDSVGDPNKTYLKTVFAGIALYALLPRQVIDAMITKLGEELEVLFLQFFNFF